jgi:predicted GNAT family N-acyltransferase
MSFLDNKYSRCYFRLMEKAQGHKRCVGRVLSDETKAKIGAASRLTQERLRQERAAAK